MNQLNINYEELKQMESIGFAKLFTETTRTYYYISKYGRVYSVHKKSKKTKTLKEDLSGAGYPTVKINNENIRIHRVVAETFIPNPEGKPCVNHIDGNPEHNDITGTIYAPNLEWVSYKENSIHAWKIGLVEVKNRENLKKAQYKQRKLTYEQAEQIRHINQIEEISIREIARRFECNPNTVRNIIDNKSYKY